MFFSAMEYTSFFTIADLFMCQYSDLVRLHARYFFAQLTEAENRHLLLSVYYV